MKQPSIVDAFSKPKPPSKTTSKKLSSINSSDSEAEAKAPVTKQKATTKRKQADSDSDSDSGDLMARIRAKTSAGSKVSLWLNSVLGLWLLLSFIHSHYGVSVELNICPNLVENQDVVGWRQLQDFRRWGDINGSGATQQALTCTQTHDLQAGLRLWWQPLNFNFVIQWVKCS